MCMSITLNRLHHNSAVERGSWKSALIFTRLVKVVKPQVKVVYSICGGIKAAGVSDSNNVNSHNGCVAENVKMSVPSTK